MTGVKTRRNSPAAGCVPCRLSGWIVGSRTRSRAATTTQTDLEATGVAATLGYKAYAPNTEPLEVRASAPVKAPSRAPRAATPSDTAAHSAGRGREVLLLPPAGPEDGLIGEGTDSCGAQAKSAQNIPCRSAEGEVHASDGGTVGPETTKAQDKDAVFSPPPRSTANSQRASHESLHPETTKAQLKELVLSPPPRNSVNSQRASRNSFNSQRASHDSFAVDAADPVGWLLRIIGDATGDRNSECTSPADSAQNATGKASPALDTKGSSKRPLTLWEREEQDRLRILSLGEGRGASITRSTGLEKQDPAQGLSGTHPSPVQEQATADSTLERERFGGQKGVAKETVQTQTNEEASVLGAISGEHNWHALSLGIAEVSLREQSPRTSKSPLLAEEETDHISEIPTFHVDEGGIWRGGGWRIGAIETMKTCDGRSPRPLLCGDSSGDSSSAPTPRTYSLGKGGEVVQGAPETADARARTQSHSDYAQEQSGQLSASVRNIDRPAPVLMSDWGASGMVGPPRSHHMAMGGGSGSGSPFGSARGAFSGAGADMGVSGLYGSITSSTRSAASSRKGGGARGAGPVGAAVSVTSSTRSAGWGTAGWGGVDTSQSVGRSFDGLGSRSVDGSSARLSAATTSPSTFSTTPSVSVVPSIIASFRWPGVRPDQPAVVKTERRARGALGLRAGPTAELATSSNQSRLWTPALSRATSLSTGASFSNYDSQTSRLSFGSESLIHRINQDLLELDKFEWEPNEEARSEAEGVNFGSLSSHSRGTIVATEDGLHGLLC